MNKEKIIEKIKKIFSLVDGGTTPNEIATATAFAKRLLDKYDISLDEVQLEHEDINYTVVDLKVKPVPSWMIEYMRHLQDLYPCRIFFNENQGWSKPVFYGYKLDCKIAKQNLITMNNLLMKKRKTSCKKLTKKEFDSFCLGFIQEVITIWATNDNGVSALAKIKKEKINQKVIKGNREYKNNITQLDMDCYVAGRIHGMIYMDKKKLKH